MNNSMSKSMKSLSVLKKQNVQLENQKNYISKKINHKFSDKQLYDEIIENLDKIESDQNLFLIGKKHQLSENELVQAKEQQKHYSRFNKLYKNQSNKFYDQFHKLIYSIYFYFSIILEYQNNQYNKEKISIEKWKSISNKLINNHIIDIRNKEELFESINLDVPQINLNKEDALKLNDYFLNIGQQYKKLILIIIDENYNNLYYNEIFSYDILDRAHNKINDSFTFFIFYSIKKLFDNDRRIQEIIEIELERIFKSKLQGVYFRKQINKKINLENSYINHNLDSDLLKSKDMEFEKFNIQHNKFQQIKNKDDYKILQSNQKKLLDKNIEKQNIETQDNSLNLDFHYSNENDKTEYQNDASRNKKSLLRSPIIEKKLPSLVHKLKLVEKKQDYQKTNLSFSNNVSIVNIPKTKLMIKKNEQLNNHSLKLLKSMEGLDKKDLMSHELKRQETDDHWYKKHALSEFCI